jgi:hypothetical protein
LASTVGKGIVNLLSSSLHSPANSPPKNPSAALTGNDTPALSLPQFLPDNLDNVACLLGNPSARLIVSKVEFIMPPMPDPAELEEKLKKSLAANKAAQASLDTAKTDLTKLSEKLAAISDGLAEVVSKKEFDNSVKNPYRKNLNFLREIWGFGPEDPKYSSMLIVQRLTLSAVILSVLLTPGMFVRWIGGAINGQIGRKYCIEIYAILKTVLAFVFLFATPKHNVVNTWIALAINQPMALLYGHYTSFALDQPTGRFICDFIACYLLADLFANVFALILLRNFWSSPFSLNRSIILLGLNFLEYNAWFGYLYLSTGGLVDGGHPIAPATALYFSMVTSATVGYGDILPTDGARVLVLFHITLSLGFLAAVVAYFVSALSGTGEDWNKSRAR